MRQPRAPSASLQQAYNHGYNYVRPVAALRYSAHAAHFAAHLAAHHHVPAVHHGVPAGSFAGPVAHQAALTHDAPEAGSSSRDAGPPRSSRRLRNQLDLQEDTSNIGTATVSSQPLYY
ncbi:uncharacterized protein [Penaeus vannamei]|uniref:uncharacterized protein n=1 Tax=Penaeus vannamei TaxID=6689 RepID=UPI00387F39E2